MPLWKRLLIASTLVLLLFVAVVGFALPEIARRQAVSWVAENTNRQLAIEDVSFNVLNGQLTVSGYHLSEAGSEEDFVTFERLVLNVNISSVWNRALIVDRLELYKPNIDIVKHGSQRFNFSDLVPAPSSESTEKEPGEPFQFAISNIIVHQGAIDYRDIEKPDIVHTVRKFDLSLPFIGNTPALADRFVQPRLSLEIDGAPFVIEGEAKPFADSLEATLQIELDNIDLPFYAAYLPRQRPFEIESGKIAVDLDLSYEVSESRGDKLLVGGEVTLTGLSVLDSTAGKLFFLPLAQVEIDWADLLARRGAIRQIAVYGLEVYVKRDSDGVWNHSRLARQPLGRTEAGESSSAPETEESVASSSERPHLTINDFRLRDGEIHFSDQGGKKPFRREIREVKIDLGRFDNLSVESTPFSLSMQITDPVTDRVGTISVDGEAGLDPLNLSAELEVGDLQLVGIESYFPPQFAGLVRTGHVDTSLQLALAAASEPSLTLTGKAGVRSLRLVEPVGNSDVLSWESLQLDGIDADLSGVSPQLRIADLSLNNYLAKIIVTSSGRINLQHMLPENGANEPAPAPVKKDETETTGEPPAVIIDQVTLQGGTLDFNDLHVPGKFETRMLNLGGRISGLDSTSEKSATIDLRGNLENRSPLNISGGIRPLGKALYADLKVRFESIEMSPMTPYSGNYLGYAIEKGKLYLDLDYRVDGDQLEAANHVFLDQFDFGNKIESENAIKLPVRLAVALLKDRRGEIHLDIPVSGNLNDPKFSVVGVVWTVLKNLLVKAATAPFKLLASLLGSGEEDFSTVTFPYGLAELQEPEKVKLTKLADALEQRPALKLEISGYVDPERDPEGWRRAELERKMKQAKLEDLKAAGGRSGDVKLSEVELGSEERSRYLETVYRAADFPKPRTAFGRIKSLPDAEMEKLILANTPAGEKQMRILAQSRAKAVHEYLQQIEKMAVERLFLKQDDIFKRPEEDDSSASRVGFGMAVE